MDFKFKEHEQKLRAEREAADRAAREREVELRGIANDLKEQLVDYAKDINPFTSARADNRVVKFAYELSKITITVLDKDSYEVLIERVGDSPVKPNFPEKVNEDRMKTIAVRYINNNI